MIQLHQYPAVWGLPSLSPFCIKVEAYLRQKKVPYRVVVETNPARGPKGRMPFVRDGATDIADSSFILRHLSKTDEEEKLSPHDQAFGHALQRMVEENLYFVLLYSRWVDARGWEKIHQDFRKLFPPFVGSPVLRLIRSQLGRQAIEQGLAAHTLEEVYEIGRKDIETLALALGNRSYFLGQKWTKVDATIYAFLITIFKQPIDTELKIALMSHENLVHYCRREERALFPEFVGKFE